MRRPPLAARPSAVRPAVAALALAAGAARLAAPAPLAAQPSAAPAAPTAAPPAPVQPASAQPAPGGWNDSTTLALVRAASARRQAQLADTALRDYRALARGFLTFLGQLGEGLREPPRVIQATQVATEVYWRAPNFSKQRVVGQRDTTVLPTDNDFYRDRYGIVQNNFPDLIRVGEGRDVADVPHPLAAGAERLYDYALRDSLSIRTPQRTYRVLELQVRPKDQSAARFVGALFLDRDAAQVVRMAFTFTRAAYLDQRNEDVSIVLENALVEGRFWLPRRQEVEVRRAGTWLDFPARGIIRGRWEIGGYEVNRDVPPAVFTGPALEFLPPERRRAYAFGGRALDSLPADVRLVSDADVQRVQAQARALVQAQVLRRARGSALSARAISDFVRVNRVEGLAVGAGLAQRVGGGVSVLAQARYGFADAEAKGRLAVERRWPGGGALRLEGFRQFREAGDEPETSLARNSLAAQEFGSDWTDPYDARGVAVALELPTERWRLGASLGAERQGALAVHARPVAGRYEATLPADRLTALRLVLDAERPTQTGPLGTELRLGVQGRVSRWVPGWRSDVGCGGHGCGTTLRVSGSAHAERPYGERRLVLHTTLAGVAKGAITAPALPPGGGAPAIEAGVPAQELVYLGGPVTAPGYAFHALAGRVGATQRVEWRVPVPFPAVSLGRYGTSPARATLAPYAHVAYLGDAAAPLRPGMVGRDGWYPSLGVGGYAFFDLLRVDVARGLGRGGRWLLTVDVTRDFWRVL